MMTKFFIDTEFIEDGSTIDLISIGIVREDGKEYYAQSVEFDPAKANQFVRHYVLPHLSICPYIETSGKIDSTEELMRSIIVADIEAHLPHGKCFPKMDDPERDKCYWRTQDHMRDEVRSFINSGEGKPEIYGWYASYDWVAICQLFGKMIELPAGWPMYIRDIKQTADELGNPQLPKQTNGIHNALEDARQVKIMHDFL